MTIEYIKKSVNEKQRTEDDENVKITVEKTLKEIELRGDDYIRELSEKFDNYSPTQFKLSEDDINKLVDEVSDNDKDDIRFAQEQVKNFAQAQLKTLSDLEGSRKKRTGARPSSASGPARQTRRRLSPSA